MAQKHRKPGAEPDSAALPGYPKRCAGIGAGDAAVPCATPHFDVQLSGRCVRCDQLHRRAQLATVDPWSSLNRPIFGDEVEEERAVEETPIRQRSRGWRWGKA